MSRTVIAASLLALAGCATTSGNAPQETRSGFDGARVVSITPHGAACRTIVCPALGVEWNSKRPDVAVLHVTVFNAYTPINAAALQIDGGVVSLEALPGVTQFNRTAGMQESSRAFTTSVDTVRRLAGAGRAWVRVSTSSGAIEEAIVEGSTDSKALHAMRRFLSQLDAGPK